MSRVCPIFLNIYWVFLVPDTSPTLLFIGTCYMFNTLAFEFCLGRHLFVWRHASRVCPIFLNIYWVFLVPDTSPTLLFIGTCYMFNTLAFEFCLGRHLFVWRHASRGCPIFLTFLGSFWPQIHRRPCFLLAPAILLTRLWSNFAWAVIFLFVYMRRVGVRFF